MASLLTPQSQVLLIDPYPRCLPLHTTLDLRESIVEILAGENNSRHLECGTEYGIEHSDEEGFQDGDGIEPSSKSFLMVSQKEESKLKSVQKTEEVLIDADRLREEKYLLKENKLILHHPYYADLCNEMDPLLMSAHG